MMKYKHIFFDLDRTLWDFEVNSYETLLEIYDFYQLKERGVSDYEEFIKIYKEYNEKLWGKYRLNKITQKTLRRERFQRTLAEFGILDAKLAEKMGEYYINLCPRKKKLFPHTFDVLDYLHLKYVLHIITNGFDKTQHIKLEHAKLKPYFNQIITSDKLGVKKPNPAIFEYALNSAGATKKESIYLGDDLVVDILGCQNFGIDGVYFNPKKIEHRENPTFEIQCLSEIKKIF